MLKNPPFVINHFKNEPNQTPQPRHIIRTETKPFDPMEKQQQPEITKQTDMIPLTQDHSGG